MVLDEPLTSGHHFNTKSFNQNCFVWKQMKINQHHFWQLYKSFVPNVQKMGIFVKKLKKASFCFLVHIISVMLIVWPRQHHLEKSDSQKLCSVSIKTIFAHFAGKTIYSYYSFTTISPFIIYVLITNLVIVRIYSTI